jgi:hypothetical protein
VVVVSAALARILAMDGMLGITDGHDEVLALIEDNLARLCREQPGTDTSDDPGLP